MGILFAHAREESNILCSAPFAIFGLEKFVRHFAICEDLRTRKAGTYQRLLTSKYFLRSMRKQNAPLLQGQRISNVR